MRLAFTHDRQVYPMAPLPFPSLQGYGYGYGYGVGDYELPSANSIISSAVGGAQMGAGTAMRTGSNVIGGVQAGVLAAAPFTGPAAPVVAAIGALIGPIASLFGGCGKTCTEATTIANQAGDALTRIKDLYFQQPVHYYSVQQAALQAFDQTAAQMQQACGNPALGSAGQRCISERLVRGGTAPWCPNPGNVGCDWITTLRDPIANDPNVVPDPVAPDSVQGVVSSVTSLPTPLLLAAAAGIALFLFAGSK